MSDSNAETDVQTRQGKPRPKWLIPTITGATALILIIAGGVGYKTWTDHEFAQSQAACDIMKKKTDKAAERYKTLIDGDVAAASKITASQVKDAKTIEGLKNLTKEKTPSIVKCDAADKTGMDETTARNASTADWYEKQSTSVKSAVDKVNASKLDKTVDTAKRLLTDSDGKVQDNKTREALTKAIQNRDEKAIAAATRQVNDSIAKKKAADEAAAKAKAEAEAKAAAEATAAAQAAQAQAQQNYSYSYTPQQSYTPTYSTTPQQQSTQQSAPQQSNGGLSGEELMNQLLAQQTPCQGLQCCAFGACKAE